MFFASGLRAQTITTVAGTGIAGYDSTGVLATHARLNRPTGIAVDHLHNFYISNSNNGIIQKVNTGEIITTIGGGGTSGLGDGGAATAAMLATPRGLCLDASGDLLIADNGNQRIRMISPAGTIATIAGGGLGGDGSPATAAALTDPSGVAIDATGAIYIADGLASCIRKIDSNGIISTFAGLCGSPGYSGDGGPAVSATFYNVTGLVFDKLGNLFVADQYNSCIRKIDTLGNVSTVAGMIGYPVYAGDGGPATDAGLNMPSGVGIDVIGNLFISDQGDNVIRRVDTFGNISTVAGNGYAGFSGDGNFATLARLDQPYAVCPLGAGNLFIADQINNRIRRVLTSSVHFVNGPRTNLYLCDSSYYISIDSALTIRDSNTGFQISWTVIEAPAHGATFASALATANGGLLGVTGLSYSKDSGYVGTDSITVAVSDGLTFDTTKIILNRISLLSPGSISGPGTVCMAATIVMAESEPGGAYSVSNANASISGSYLTGLNTGLDTVIYRETNSCGVTSASYPVTINTIPTIAPILGNGRLCHGHYDTLSDVTPGGTWHLTNSNASITGTIVHATIPGRDTVTYTVSNICGSNIQSMPLVIDSLPTTTVSGTDSFCSGSMTVLSATLPGGTWTSRNGRVFVLDTGDVYGVTPGVDTVLYTLVNTCGTTTTSHTIKVINHSGGTITGPATVCLGDSMQLVDTTMGGAGVWHITNTNASCTNGRIKGLHVGVDTVTYTISNFCGPAAARRVMNIEPLPLAATISGADSVCRSGSTLFTATIVGGNWATTNLDALVTTAGEVYGVNTGYDTITYTVSSAYCTATTKKSVFVKDFPATKPIYGADTLCKNAVITLSDSSGTGYWSVSNYCTSITGMDSQAVVAGVEPGENIVYFSQSNACGTTTVSKVVNVVPPAPVPVVSGPSAFCIHDTILFSAVPPAGLWFVSNASAIRVGSGDTLHLAGKHAGTDTILFAGLTNCGYVPVYAELTVKGPPAKSPISGDTLICAGTSFLYTDSLSGGIWHATNARATVGSSGVLTAVSAGKDTLVYTTTNDCGTTRDSLKIKIVTSGAACLLGLSGQTEMSGISLTPNPAHDYVKISSINNVIINNISIVSFDGKTVNKLFCVPTADEWTIPVASLPPGLYVVIIETEGGKEFRKLILY